MPKITNNKNTEINVTCSMNRQSGVFYCLAYNFTKNNPQITYILIALKIKKKRWQNKKTLKRVLHEKRFSFMVQFDPLNSEN